MCAAAYNRIDCHRLAAPRWNDVRRRNLDLRAHQVMRR
jgi:hypothetical protein